MFTIQWTMHDPNGAPVTFTLGDGANLDEVKRVAALRLQLIPILTGQGWTIERVVNLAEAAPEPERMPEAAPAGNAKTFFAQTLSVTSEDDKTFYKVKGGEFSKFGVTVYPEVLRAAGIELKSQPLDGWQAWYNETEKDGKTQRKVTRLAKF